MAPSAAPQRQATRTMAGVDSPACAATPATTPQIANTEPTEMSISPVRMMSVAPIATNSTGRFPSRRSPRFSGEKNRGLTSASTSEVSPMAAATDNSRR